MTSPKLKAAFISQLREVATDFDIEIRDDYSGRGMYGARCFAITGDAEEAREAALCAICRTAADFAIADDSFMPDDLAFISQWSSDQMGLDVVLYWPEIHGGEE